MSWKVKLIYYNNIRDFSCRNMISTRIELGKPVSLLKLISVVQVWDYSKATGSLKNSLYLVPAQEKLHFWSSLPDLRAAWHVGEGLPHWPRGQESVFFKQLFIAAINLTVEISAFQDLEGHLLGELHASFSLSRRECFHIQHINIYSLSIHVLFYGYLSTLHIYSHIPIYKHTELN